MGYFVLGPTELYKLTKEIGKALQNFRSLSTEASKQFETSMEDQLDLQELRKAQRELDLHRARQRPIFRQHGLPTPNLT